MCSSLILMIWHKWKNHRDVFLKTKPPQEDPPQENTNLFCCPFFFLSLHALCYCSTLLFWCILATGEDDRDPVCSRFQSLDVCRCKGTNEEHSSIWHAFHLLSAFSCPHPHKSPLMSKHHFFSPFSSSSSWSLTRTTSIIKIGYDEADLHVQVVDKKNDIILNAKSGQETGSEDSRILRIIRNYLWKSIEFDLRHM